jgi:nucleoside-diphosphate-sugar epimerase
MRVAVFGGSGFIGSRLVSRLLHAGHDIIIADIVRSSSYPELTTICDVRNAQSVREACRGAEVIYNLAAVHRDDVRPRSLYHEVNVDGSRNICDAAAALEIGSIIFTSSVAIYGFSSSELDEDAQPAPFNDYGVTKLEAEGVYKAWFDHGLNRSLVIVRPTVVFGEGNRGNVFTLIDQIARGRFAVVGDGKNIKSLAYVENVAAFLEHVLHGSCGTNIYNYADKPDYTTGDLVRTIRRHLGRMGDGPHVPYTLAMTLGACCDAFAAVSRRRLPFSRIRVQKFCSPSRFSNARTMALGYSPPFPLADGLQRTIAHEIAGAPRSTTATSWEPRRG